MPVGAPEGFVEHAYSKTFYVGHPVGRVWAWLNDPATFVEGPVWPFRVEFVDGGFEPGVLNVHHGPFLNAAGAIGEVRGPGERPAYRDLKYFYGSYAISPSPRPSHQAPVVGRRGGGGHDGNGTPRRPRAPAVRAPLGPRPEGVLVQVPALDGLGAKKPRGRFRVMGG